MVVVILFLLASYISIMLVLESLLVVTTYFLMIVLSVSLYVEIVFVSNLFFMYSNI